MAPKFGTSGLRGLVTELTPELVGDYTRAFLVACPQGNALHVGRDLRASSPDLAEAVMAAARSAGLDVIDHGALPTPALALEAMTSGDAAIMVTGSHIPADRNGLKFYRPDGEISKEDEMAILDAFGTPTGSAAPQGTRRKEQTATQKYVDRYVSAFGTDALQGLRIGVYEHSSVARDVMGTALRDMGAVTVSLARADHFIPVDTEAVDPDTRSQLASWCHEHGLDAVVSTDGDADRPMVTDARGRMVLGDVLGPLTARMLGADVIATPVSSNSLVEKMGVFSEVKRTRIGSPYVIAAMEAAGAVRVAGYEANGGFLLGFEALGPNGALPPLMTRDSLLPIVAPLAAARAAGTDLAKLVDGLPARFTAADRIAGIPSDVSQVFLARLTEDRQARSLFFTTLASEDGLDLTDGLRVSFSDGRIVHLRPSGNAPEFRCYAEAEDPDTASQLVLETLARLRKELG